MAHDRTQHQRSRKLRSRGNLGYLDFVRLVTHLWAQSHPDIPILPTGNDKIAKYPCILYGLELRQTHRDEPKMRLRETLDGEGNAVVVYAQRFQNIVSFTAVTEGNPKLCEAVIESFEDFMLEMTPIFKESGASEFVYSRRYADDEDSRSGTGVVKRKVAYMLTTEKVRSTEVSRLETIMLNVSTLGERETDESIYIHEGSTQYRQVTPRYYMLGNILPDFYQTAQDVEEDLITVPLSSFFLGDRVYLSHKLSAIADFPPDINPNYYVISNVVGEPFHAEIKYSLQDMDGNPITDYGPFSVATPPTGDVLYRGKIRFEPESDVEVEILDAATPNLT